MRPFQSNAEYFAAVEALIAKLQLEGFPETADELKAGYRSINGLTDGSGLFLDSLERVQAARSERFSPDVRQQLEAIRAATHKAVYRR
jgi:hypothetical protein